MIKLRPYQQEALEKVIEVHAHGVNHQLIVLPCGTGKTIVMAAIAKHFDKKTLIIAHRDELIQQTKDKFHIFWPKAAVGICKADKNDLQKKIVVGSIQTCSRPNRLAQLKNESFEILFIDEAHHAYAATYKKLIHELGFDGSKLMIGFTATPERSKSKEKLSDMFDVVYLKSISTMIDGGYLCPVSGRKILTTTSLAGIKTTMGDFAQEQLATRVNTDERNGYIVSKYKQYAENKKSVAFCANVKHAQTLAAAFKQEGIKAEAVWGSMPFKARKKVLNNLSKGRLAVVTSVGILTEGYDETSLEVAIMATPTKSKVKYIQCIGRILRLHVAKSNALVLDFSDQFHNLDAIMSLKGTIECTNETVDDSLIRPQSKTIDAHLEEVSDEEFDILGKQRFCWVDIGDDEYSLADDSNNEIIIRPIEGGYVADLYVQKIGTQLITQPLPLEYCRGCAEDYARQFMSLYFADMQGNWMQERVRQQPTQTQLGFLKKHNVSCNGLTKITASLEIRRIIALQNKHRRLHPNENEPATDKQLFVLEQAGYKKEELATMSKHEAMIIISRLFQKQPAPISTSADEGKAAPILPAGGQSNSPITH